MNNQLTPKEANIILQILTQAAPSIRVNINDFDKSLNEMREFKELIDKLKRLAEPVEERL